MAVFWLIAFIGIITGILHYHNGQHILKHKEAKFRYTGAKDKSASNTVGFLYIFSGVIYIILATWFLIIILSGNDLSNNFVDDFSTFFPIYCLAVFYPLSNIFIGYIGSLDN